MDFLPKDLEDIILDYRNQLEHTEKFKKCMDKIKEQLYFVNNEHGAYMYPIYSSLGRPCGLNIEPRDISSNLGKLYGKQYRNQTRNRIEQRYRNQARRRNMRR